MAATRQIVKSGGPLEDRVGYARAVRAGDHAFVAGTTALGTDGVAGKGDVGKQTRVCIERIEAALSECGFELRHVVRTRVSLAVIEDWESAGEAHHEAFADIRPVTAFYAGIQFLHPDIMVEIEADAVLTE